MSIYTRMLKQRAAYWPPGDRDEFGQPTYLAVEEIKCRWEDKSIEFTSGTGEKAVSQAVVYVDRELQLGGLLRKGALDSVTDVLVPRNNDGVHAIQQIGEIPNMKAHKFLRPVIL